LEVCRDLLAEIPRLTSSNPPATTEPASFLPFTFSRRPSTETPIAEALRAGGTQPVRVIVTRAAWEKLSAKIRPGADVRPEGIYEELSILEVDPEQEIRLGEHTGLVTVRNGVRMPAISAFRLLAAKLKTLGRQNPILLKDTLEMEVPSLEPRIALLRGSVVIGSLLADGIGDAVMIRGEPAAGLALRLAFNILQASGCRSFKTDYVACPSCGRTLFHLQTVTARIKSRTEHLKGVKIAIMGCIVNGPGEMADADFGYVGGAPGKINLYVGKTAVKFNIPEAEAVERLVDLIREHGKWIEPEPREETVPA
jgi:(E)-4-hydroxy-3-methylbut-2-enyl-diphosphate synthase